MHKLELWSLHKVHLRKYFLDLCIAGQCNTNINPKNYVKLESEKYSSHKKKNGVYRIREI